MTVPARIATGVAVVLALAGSTYGLLRLLERPAPAPVPLAAPPPAPALEPPPPAPPPPEEPPPAEPGPPELAAEPEVPLVRPAGKPLAVRSAVAPAPEPGPPRDTTPPPLEILAPVGPTVLLNPKLLLRVRSEPGARVLVGDQALAENSPGLYALDLRIGPGPNELVVAALDADGNRAEARVRATYLDPARYARDRERFQALLAQIDEARALTDDLDHRITGIVSRLKSIEDADQVTALSKELREVRQLRRELEFEVTKVVQEIDQLLGGAAR